MYLLTTYKLVNMFVVIDNVLVFKESENAHSWADRHTYRVVDIPELCDDCTIEFLQFEDR